LPFVATGSGTESANTGVVKLLNRYDPFLVDRLNSNIKAKSGFEARSQKFVLKDSWPDLEDYNSVCAVIGLHALCQLFSSVM